MFWICQVMRLKSSRLHDFSHEYKQLLLNLKALRGRGQEFISDFPFSII
jgi:hypothetical protein